MSKLNRTCCVDGVKYSYCPNCTKDNDKPVWMLTFCSENCKNIYEVCAGYFAKMINIEDAKKMLSKCDLSKLDHFTTATQRLIKEINSYEEAEKEELILEVNNNLKNTLKNKKKK